MERYIEVSTAFVYKSQVKQPAKEDAELQPWTLQAKYKLEAEEEIRRLPDLKAVFLRLATVCHTHERIRRDCSRLRSRVCLLACALGVWISRLDGTHASDCLRCLVCVVWLVYGRYVAG